MVRYRLRRIKGEIQLLEQKLDPGPNLVLLWRQFRRKVMSFRSLLLRRHNPDDPYAMVTVPTRPQMPRRSGSVAVDPYEY